MKCPRCDETKLYSLTRRRQVRCSRCLYSWMPDRIGLGRAYKNDKQSLEWYDTIIQLYLSGLNGNQIAKQISGKYTATFQGKSVKSVYYFLHRWRADLAACID